MMQNLPRITRSLLWANILVFLLDAVLGRSGLVLSHYLGLHYVLADTFHFWQPLTYMFMHADLGHIFCNMFALFMFGPVLEREWGERRFLWYYLICGLGAGLVQECVWALMYQPSIDAMGAAGMGYLANRFCTIGASGAVFGLLFAFGWLYPNVPMFLMFIPIPIRARVFVIGYAVIELLAGLGGAADGVAHFAHLGGFLFGWLLLLYWCKRGFGDDDDFGGGIRRWWNKVTSRFRKHPTLDSSEDKDYSDYHYHKRL